MKQKTCRKVFSLLMALAMVLSIAPVTAFALPQMKGSVSYNKTSAKVREPIQVTLKGDAARIPGYGIEYYWTIDDAYGNRTSETTGASPVYVPEPGQEGGRLNVLVVATKAGYEGSLVGGWIPIEGTPPPIVHPVKPEGIEVNAKNFPDAGFRQYIKDQKIDYNNNGILEKQEISGVLDITASAGSGKVTISDLTGLEHFTALQSLGCSGQKIGNLDVSRNPKLRHLKCDGCGLTKLDVTNNPNLELLDCRDNLLPSVNVTRNPKLKTLRCDDNRLTALDVRQNPALEILSCSGNAKAVIENQEKPTNELTALDLSRNTKLKDLNCEGNHITALDLSTTSITDVRSLRVADNYFYSREGAPFSTLANFDKTKVKSVSKGSFDTGKVHFNPGEKYLFYQYDIGKGQQAEFCLVNENPSASEIRYIQASITRPTAGMKPTDVRVTIPANQNYQVKDGYVMAWSVGNTYAGSDAMMGNFEAGKTYWGNIKIDSKDAKKYRFTETTATGGITGSDGVEKYTVFADGAYAEVVVKFVIPVDGVVVNEKNFPDKNFRAFVADIAGAEDGVLDREELGMIHVLDCSGMDIADLTGIGHFEWLVTLGCSNNRLASLDLSKNTRLTHLECTNNRRNVSDGTDVGSLPGFDGNKVSGLTGGNFNGGKVHFTGNELRYTYNCGNGMKAEFCLVSGNAAADFVDVPADEYYAEPVRWAVEKKITGGTGNGRFSPNMVCTRAQAVTFLWRAAGCPAPKSTAMPFADVPADAYFADAVLWAKENNVTGGTGAGKFSPNMNCSRSQIVTFLWRAQKSPKAEASSAFRDVPANAYYADAVAWAVANKITGGTGNGRFSPDMNCSRGQIVTFLYRTMQ